MHLTKTDTGIRLTIDVDKQYKRLFMEAAKSAKARVQLEEQYLTEGEQDAIEFLLRNPNNKVRLTESIRNAEGGRD